MVDTSTTSTEGMPERNILEKRILLVTPTTRDAEISQSLLAAEGLISFVCADLEQCVKESLEGAGALMIAESALLAGNADSLLEMFQRQPSWSDLPLIVLVRGGAADSPQLLSLVHRFSNATLLEIPVRISTCLSVIRASLRARERQYQIRDRILAQQQTEEMLQDAHRRKDEFLAMLAHELRNPLAPIRNAAQVLQLASPQDPILQRQQAIIQRQVSHMARLLDDLLDVSRITRGNISLQKAPVRVSDVLARAVEIALPLIEARQHTLRVTPPEEMVEVYGDADRLVQIVGNVLSNAAKYTEAGGTIWLNTTREGERVVISVRDTGIGIAPEMLSRIFEAFTQAEHSLDRSQGGLGLGLSLVRSLALMHGGDVEAFSAGLGQGSEFAIRLPVLPQQDKSHPPEEDSQTEVVSLPCRVLIVDDVRDTAETLAELLGLWGHEARTAGDGSSALAAAQEFCPDLILLDIGLPGDNGYEVARQIRGIPELKNVMLAALTGYGQEEDRRMAEEAGFDMHFTKPVDLVALQSLLARRIERSLSSF